MIQKPNKKYKKTGSVTYFSFNRVTRMLWLIFFLFFICYDSIFSYGVDNGAELYLSQSDEAIKSAFISMLEAEREGADANRRGPICLLRALATRYCGDSHAGGAPPARGQGGP